MSIALLVWVVLTMPGALLDTISHVLDWNRVLLTPTDHFSEQVQGGARSIPFLSNLPVWNISLVYIVLLIAGVAWHYFSNISAVAKREIAIATHGNLGEISPDHIPLTAAEITGVLGGFFSFGVGSSMLAAATAGAVLGPPGIALGAAIGGIASMFFAGRSSERREEEARKRAAEQTLEQERRRLALAAENISKFKAYETRKLFFAATAVAVIVVGQIMWSNHDGILDLSALILFDINESLRQLGLY
ncbi:MAG: hypothetical protein K2Y04_06975 [Caulobacteraceae bacterium]|nr:hypothetical protein [Caulobacteraceae bacterium]